MSKSHYSDNFWRISVLTFIFSKVQISFLKYYNTQIKNKIKVSKKKKNKKITNAKNNLYL